MSWSGPGPGPEPAAEALWEQELARLCASRVPLRALPYAMVDKRLIRWVPAPPGREGRAAPGRGREGRTQAAVTTPVQAAAGAPRREDLEVAAVAAPAAEGCAAPGGGGPAAVPRLRALGGGALRDRG